MRPVNLLAVRRATCSCMQTCMGNAVRTLGKCGVQELCHAVVVCAGGAFMAGDPRMYCPAFKLWMKKMAAQGISMRVLSVGYPLSPENSFPAPVQAAAAAYRWLLKQLKAEGRKDTVLIGKQPCWGAGGKQMSSCASCLVCSGIACSGQPKGYLGVHCAAACCCCLLQALQADSTMQDEHLTSQLAVQGNMYLSCEHNATRSARSSRYTCKLG